MQMQAQETLDRVETIMNTVRSCRLYRMHIFEELWGVWNLDDISTSVSKNL